MLAKMSGWTDKNLLYVQMGLKPYNKKTPPTLSTNPYTVQTENEGGATRPLLFQKKKSSSILHGSNEEETELRPKVKLATDFRIMDVTDTLSNNQDPIVIEVADTDGHEEIKEIKSKEVKAPDLAEQISDGKE